MYTRLVSGYCVGLPLGWVAWKRRFCRPKSVPQRGLARAWRRHRRVMWHACLFFLPRRQNIWAALNCPAIFFLGDGNLHCNFFFPRQRAARQAWRIEASVMTSNILKWVLVVFSYNHSLSSSGHRWIPNCCKGLDSRVSRLNLSNPFLCCQTYNIIAIHTRNSQMPP
jgi:hypothetical protein